MPTTPNRQIRYPEGPDAPNVPLDMSEMAADLDNVTSLYSGTLVARGNASTDPGTAKGSPGSFYYATDTGELFASLGGAWIKVTTEPGIPIGGMIDYDGLNDPADTRFVLADGRVLDPAAYPAYCAQVGTRNNVAGDADTVRRVFDSRGAVTVAPDNMGTSQGAANRMGNNPRTLGLHGGVPDVKLVASQSGMPSHNHADTFDVTLFGSFNTGTENQSLNHGHALIIAGAAVAPAAHVLAYAGGVQAVPNSGQGAGPFNFPHSTADGWGGTSGVHGHPGSEAVATSPPAHNHTVPAHKHDITGSVSAAAAKDAVDTHTNLQPYAVANKIIRVK